jgi:hypothetical protein
MLLAVTLAFVSVVGCNTSPGKPSLMANVAKEDITVYQLRAVDYEYASQFAQLVAACALDIASKSDDGLVREQAYQWRMWAMPQARAAAFDQDPLAGLLELWILAAQQHLFFKEGNGRDWFGGQETCAIGTARSLEREAEALMAAAVPASEMDRMRESGHDWVVQHPIEGQLFVRPTARADLAALVPEEKHGGLKAVGSMEETLRDLSDRVTILSVQTPAEVRWQAEYLVNSLFEDRVRDRIDSMVGSMTELTGFLETFEGTLSAQTTALLEGIERERLTVFEAIESERDAILGAIDEGSDDILSAVDSQVASAAAELDQVGRGLIDHFFVRLIEVLAVTGIAIFLTVLLVLLVLRKRGSSND